MARCSHHTHRTLKVLTFTICAISSNHGTGQTTRYMLVLHSAKLEPSNAAYVGPGSFFRVDRRPDNVTELNAHYNYLQDLPTDTMCTWLGYIKVKNKWKGTLIKGQMHFCEILEGNIPMYRGFYDHSNFPTNCPVKKGNYTISQFTYDKIELPPVGVVPDSHYKIVNTFITEKTKLFVTTLEVKVGKRNRD